MTIDGSAFHGPAGKVNIFDWTLEWAHKTGIAHVSDREIDSTNRLAKDDQSSARPVVPSFGSVSEPTLYLAERQTHGRGRGSNIWQTPPGAALLSSWSFMVARPPQPILAPLVGLSLYEAAMATWPHVEFNLKAPNDLFIGDEKVAGILIETVYTGREIHVVIGIGMNVFESPSEVPHATSLAAGLSATPSVEDWSRFLSTLKSRLAFALHAGQEDMMEPETCTRLRSALNRHPLLSEPILHVDPRGELHSASRVIHWHEL